jgi:hypothetical protein
MEGDGTSRELSISNEFTSVRIRKVHTRNGERLEIRSAKLGFWIHLDPLELEALTWQSPALFSELLETPYGPEDDVNDIRPLTDLVALEAGPPESWTA